MLLGGCASPQPIRTVGQVDLPRFMGDWYVIANIPTFIEQGAYNSVESYRLAEDGSIDTTFRFRDGGFDGELKQYDPRGFVRDGGGNAVWDMQFIWPFRAEYRIIYLSADYAHTIIGRSKRDYVWIMARSPTIAEPAYADMLAFLAEQGYDISLIEKVPQRW
ncbi:MAG TPA: lipocalin family protein [Gammaproteobacteria bacterium]|nr:lipocalin family protein [Gammaproteobacteria bacterium]